MMLTDRALWNWFSIPIPDTIVVIQITHFVRLESGRDVNRKLVCQPRMQPEHRHHHCTQSQFPVNQYPLALFQCMETMVCPATAPHDPCSELLKSVSATLQWPHRHSCIMWMQENKYLHLVDHRNKLTCLFTFLC